jgi:hypothetical protein
MARGHACEHGPRQGPLAEHRLARGRHGEATGRGNAEGVHPFADEVFTEHRPEGGPAVAIAGVAGAAGALELDVEPAAVGRELLAEEDRPAVTEVPA